MKGAHCSVMAVLAVALCSLQMIISGFISSSFHFLSCRWVFLSCSYVYDIRILEGVLHEATCLLVFALGVLDRALDDPLREKTHLPFNIHADSPSTFFVLCCVVLLHVQNHYLHTFVGQNWSELFTEHKLNGQKRSQRLRRRVHCSPCLKMTVLYGSSASLAKKHKKGCLRPILDAWKQNTFLGGWIHTHKENWNRLLDVYK